MENGNKPLTEEELKEIRHKIIRKHIETSDNEDDSISIFFEYHNAMIEYAEFIANPTKPWIDSPSVKICSNCNNITGDKCNRCEKTKPMVSDAVEFAEWLNKCQWVQDHLLSGGWFSLMESSKLENDELPTFKTTQELYELFTQSKNQK